MRNESAHRDLPARFKFNAGSIEVQCGTALLFSRDIKGFVSIWTNEGECGSTLIGFGRKKLNEINQ